MKKGLLFGVGFLALLPLVALALPIQYELPSGAGTLGFMVVAILIYGLYAMRRYRKIAPIRFRSMHSDSTRI